MVFNWGKRPSDVFRKRREEDAARRLLTTTTTSSDHHLPDRPSLDGYSVREVPPDQAAQLLFKLKRQTT